MTTVKIRATIIKLPDSGPGLLVAGDRQFPFTLDHVWRSAVAPAVNMAVEIEKDAADSVGGIWAVDPQQLAKESLDQFGKAAHRHGRQAAAKATQGVGNLAARMGKVTLCLTALLWIAFFWMPAAGFNAGLFAKSFSFWQILGVDLENGSLQSHGIFSLLAIAALLGPVVACYWRSAQAHLLNAAPLAYLIAAVLRIRSTTGAAGASMAEIRATNMFSIKAGGYVLSIVAAILAVRAFRTKY
jgi:hypothetical protein